MKVFRSFAVAVAALACAAAFAQSVDYRLENSGRVTQTAQSAASASNIGTAESVAKGMTSSTTTGYISSNAIAGGQQLAIGGATETVVQGQAYNISTNGGTGTAGLNSWSDANVKGYNNFTNAHGNISMSGETDSGMSQPVLRGPDVNISAGRNQDGFGYGADGGSFTGAGYTQQLAIAGGAQVAAAVVGTTESHSYSETGGVNFAVSPPSNTAAFRQANAGNVTVFNGNYYDPAGN